MEKQEFLAVLKQSLLGEMPDYEVDNHVRYYESYLVDDANKTTAEKLRELGEPRLIAKTIIDAYMVKQEGSGYKKEYYSYSYQDEDTDDIHGEQQSSQHAVKYYNWNTMAWYQKLIAIVVGIVIVVVLLGLIGLGVNIFFSIILPVLLVLFGIRMILNLFR